jgi:hypothetical protein
MLMLNHDSLQKEAARKKAFPFSQAHRLRHPNILRKHSLRQRCRMVPSSAATALLSRTVSSPFVLFGDTTPRSEGDQEGPICFKDSEAIEAEVKLGTSNAVCAVYGK